jgi:Rhodopirellula transposase DDE domain
VIPGPTGGKAIPYGVYDLHRDEGWVSVGIDYDTATFATRAIRRWWQSMGRPVYKAATTLLITADAGGSNGARLRLWKWELQQLADRTGLTITVCHFPPGTSKWNKIEHRLFSHIAMTWRGTPLVDLNTIVSLIGATRSHSGLHVRAELDRGRYPAGLAVPDARWPPCGSGGIASTGTGITPFAPRHRDRSHSYSLTGPNLQIATARLERGQTFAPPAAKVLRLFQDRPPLDAGIRRHFATSRATPQAREDEARCR